MSRKRIPVLIAVMAAILLLVALWPDADSLYDLTGEEALPGQLRGVVHWMYSAVRPQPEQAPEAELAHAEVVPFGMNTFLQGEVLPEVREQSLQMLRDAGFGYIRQQFPWEDIEIHGKGDFVDRRNDPNGVDAWTKYDNIVDLAEQYDIKIIARLDNPPAWTRIMTDTIGTHAPPDDFKDYGDYVEAVVSRYRDRITYFQLWNEPNIYPEWGEQLVSPEAYTELLCLGYRRAKEANPDAVILAGALSPTTRSLLADEGLANRVQSILVDAGWGSEPLRDRLSRLFGDLSELAVEDLKRDTLDMGELAASAFTTIFIVSGLFGITAGLVLIFLIFVMLAAERKSEMGMARAVGAQRGRLVEMFVFEGTAYDLAAAADGVALGIVTGLIIAYTLGRAFAGVGLSIRPSVSVRSLLVSYSLGMLVTFITVLVSANRVSHLNIVSAIRDLPDPPRPPTYLRDRLLGPFRAIADAFRYSPAAT